MVDQNILRHVVGFSLLTALAVALLLTLRIHTSATTTIWLPAGIAMAGFYLLRQRRWPQLSLAFILTVFPAFLLGGIDVVPAFAFTVGMICQSMICAAISERVLANIARLPSSTSHIAGIFFAAVIGSLIGGLIVLPFQIEQTMYYYAWWVLSNVVGILAATSLTINLWRRSINASIEFAGEANAKLVLALIGCAATATLVLKFHTIALFPVLILVIVLIGTRFGQLGSSCSVMVTCLTSFGLSIVFGSPIPGLTLDPNYAGLLIQGWMILVLAIVLPLSATLLKRDALERELRERNDRLHENITILGLAEQLAGIGRYRLDLKSGAQDWSPHMLELHGLPAELAPDPGDLKRILPDQGGRLFAELEANAEAQVPYSFDYPIVLPSGGARILRMSFLNEFDRAGERTAVFGVAIDVTEQIRREEALDMARGRAVRLAAEAQKMANTDALTGLPNRRCTFARLQVMVENAELRNRPLAAVMFDIDHFKKVNDTHGHQAGDDVLVKVAQLARAQTRSGDLVGRIGGEEFVWLLPNIPEREVGRLAERLRQAIEKGTRDQDHPQVTASIGMAMYRPGDDEETLLARADAALYAAKDAGRNQVKLAA